MFSGPGAAYRVTMASSQGGSIGEFLRARRELIRPEDVGIAVTSRRRVPGLRRDELAMLAGISTEYYTRLEQGRDQHPSAQVLDALARALRLDTEAARYLHQLAAPRPTRRARRRRAERVTPSLQELLAGLHNMPAYVQGRYMDVLAANSLAIALSPSLQPGTNIVRSVFLDPAVHDLFDEWEQGLEGVVASLRALAGPDVDDPRLTELVGELSVRSQAFRRLWSRHDVRAHIGGGIHRMHHPQVGQLELQHEKFSVAGADGQMLVIYHAAPGSASERALGLLGTLVAESGTASRRRRGLDSGIGRR